MEVRPGYRGARRDTSATTTGAPAPTDSKDSRRSTHRVPPGGSQGFVATIDQLECGAPTVSVIGEVDAKTAPALEQTLLGVVEYRTGEAIVDLTGCSLLDSRGLEALIATSARRGRSNRPLALVLPNPSALQLFQVTRFDETFEIYPSLLAAGNANVHV
jgi:anti-anti-sigma factor